MCHSLFNLLWNSALWSEKFEFAAIDTIEKINAIVLCFFTIRMRICFHYVICMYDLPLLKIIKWLIFQWVVVQILYFIKPLSLKEVKIYMFVWCVCIIHATVKIHAVGASFYSTCKFSVNCIWCKFVLSLCWLFNENVKENYKFVWLLPLSVW